MFRLGGLFLIVGLLLTAAVFAFPGGGAQGAAPVVATEAGLLPTPTPLPANPATLNSTQLALSGVQGVVFVLVLFGLFGLYLALRSLNRER